MRLSKLRLQNYRVHSDSTLDIGDSTFVVIRGANASGKTSLVEALSMNLAKTTPTQDGDGKKFTAKIKQGESKAVITADFQGQHLLRNTVTLNTNTSGRTCGAECLDEPENKDALRRFDNFIGDRKTSLLVAVNTEYFVSREEKEQKNILAKLVLPPRYDFPEDKIKAVQDELGTGVVDFNGEPFTAIQTAYKKLYDEREIANRQVKEFIIPEPLPAVKGVDSVVIEAQVVSAKVDRANLLAQRDQAVAKTNEIEIKRGRLQTKIEGLQGEVRRGKERLTVLETIILSADDVKRFTETAARKDELTKLKQQHQAYLGGMRAVDSQIERLRGITDNGATCPTCDQEIDSARIATLTAELQKEIDDADTKLQELDTQIEAIGDVHGAQESLRKHEAAVKEKAELEASLLETVKTGKATREELNALGEKQDAVAPFIQPIADIEQKINSLTELLRPAISYEERNKEIATRTEQKKKLQARAATLDILVKYFDKDGIKAKLIGQYIGGFESKINTVLEAFGYNTSLTMEPFNFEVVTKRDYAGPVKELCKAERHFFFPAFQCAVSIASGINMVVVDDMDSYLKETGLRGKMYATLYGLVATGVLEQVILIEASIDKTLPPVDKRAPGAKYFFVEDGTVEELK